ncbi:MAG: carbon-nitrogen hydrolase family protein [Polaromonas sp.]|nr:carbon-nitrogen hydrolase family protein [Polaromonas sp.]
MKVAAIQMVSSTDVPRNLQAAGRLLAEAAAAGAELAVLPEYFCIMGRADTDKLAVAESPGAGPIQDFLADAASRLGLWIVGGTLPLASSDPERVRNSCTAWSPAGVCVARYDKIHLFRFDDGSRQYDETRSIEPGREPQRFVMTSKAGQRITVALSVCYDLRFPELYRALAADLLVVPSAFTYPTGQAHWEVLLRARAIENLAAVVAPAQGGLHENGRRTWGHSLVVDAWGGILAQQAEGEGVVLAEIDAARQAALRRQLPVLDHRVL